MKLKEGDIVLIKTKDARIFNFSNLIPLKKTRMELEDTGRIINMFRKYSQFVLVYSPKLKVDVLVRKKDLTVENLLT